MSTAHRRPKQPEQLRQQLLQATAELTVAKGAPAVTLDAVARQAGVSKGGLLHHFPSKQALFEQLFEGLLGEFDRAVQDRATTDPDPRGRAARAYLMAGAQGFGDGAEQQRWMALVAALIGDPALRTRWRDWDAAACAPDAAPGEDPTLLLICRLAADGLWLADLLGSRGLDTAQREAVLARLQAFTRGQTGPDAPLAPRSESP